LFNIWSFQRKKAESGDGEAENSVSCEMQKSSTLFVLSRSVSPLVRRREKIGGFVGRFSSQMFYGSLCSLVSQNTKSTTAVRTVPGTDGAFFIFSFSQQ
jgi:hypothetical protein